MNEHNHRVDTPAQNSPGPAVSPNPPGTRPGAPPPMQQPVNAPPRVQPQPPPVQHAAPPPQPQFVARQPVAPVTEERPAVIEQQKVFSHSSLVYWWPVWLMGYVMAALTYWQGSEYQIGADLELFHTSSNLGVFFFLTLFLVIIITNVSARGLVSGLVIMGVVLVSVILAYFALWDNILTWFGNLEIHLNFGAYFWFSTLMLTMWVVSTFIVDRMSYWHFTPGQVTHVVVLGAGSRSFDTNGMMLEKHREDLFRHWLLGVGSGDLKIRTSGATREEIDVPNVMFLGTKIEVMQRLIAQEPNADDI